MALHEGDKIREECRRSGHPIDWHWADGRPRKTCGFCGDELDHSQCKYACLGDAVTRPVVESGS